MLNMEKQQSAYLIIAGTNKAATTSFFNYLAAHPQVCPAYIKQTFFFLDKSWQRSLNLRSLYDHSKGFQQYDLFFRDCSDAKYRLEASPEYMYAPGSPARIHDFLKTNNGRVIFILRDPVQRFISLFNYGKQQGIIGKQETFPGFMKKSMAYTGNSNTSLMAYQTGFYSGYVQNYISLFGKQNLNIYFYENLKADPLKFMQHVSENLGLDGNFYSSFNFTKNNQTISTRSSSLAMIYKLGRGLLIDRGYKSRVGYNAAMVLKKYVTPVYRKLNTQSLNKEEVVSVEAIQQLTEAYKKDRDKLHQLTGLQVPW